MWPLLWLRRFAITFAGFFYYFKLVSCWILFCIKKCSRHSTTLRSTSITNQKGKHVKNSLKCDFILIQTFEVDVSFSYFKFLTKINSKMRPAKGWSVAGCFGRLSALIDSPGLNERLYPQKSILLWLLLPLNDQVRPTKLNCITKQDSAERASLKCSIGISDGRCVQRGGTFVRDRRLHLSVPSTNAVARLSFPASGNPRRLAAALSVVSTRW